MNVTNLNSPIHKHLDMVEIKSQFEIAMLFWFCLMAKHNYRKIVRTGVSEFHCECGSCYSWQN